MWPCGSSGAPHNGQGGRPAADDPRGARDERARRVGGDPDAQQVRTVLVLVVVLVGVDRLAVLGLGARLDQHALRVAVPAERQRAGPERLVERLVERPVVLAGGRRGDLRRRRDAATLELGQELAEPVGEDRDLDLLERRSMTTRGPSRACRKNVRSPGRPTVPATNRSGGSNR